MPLEQLQLMPIESLRVRLQIDRQDLAAMLGVPSSKMLRWERHDSTNVPKLVVRQLSQILKYPEDSIFLGKNKEFIEKLQAIDGSKKTA